MNRAIPHPRLTVQFQLHHALIGLTVAAIALAVLSPWLRSLTTAQWSRLAFSLAPISAGLAVGYVVFSQKLRAAARKAGEPEFIMDNEPYPWSRSVAYSLGAIGVATSFASALFIPDPSLFMKLFIPFAAGFNLLLAAWWQSTEQQVWLSQQGVIIGGQFLRWKDVRLIEKGDIAIRFQYRGTKLKVSGSPTACEYFAAACGTSIAGHASSGTTMPVDSLDCPVNGAKK